ncbi:hypothetical protein C1645_779948 [Glomus cerebriforme]|uniref:Uncharacterized protein n=1 Tax=Glomus cerebriforme TaxID=658196 RepID=A0A397SJT8_9GLOM|nr:hypothetical protein C1645_779948 [Glomus cerebriforme]
MIILISFFMLIIVLNSNSQFATKAELDYYLSDAHGSTFIHMIDFYNKISLNFIMNNLYKIINYVNHKT